MNSRERKRIIQTMSANVDESIQALIDENRRLRAEVAMLEAQLKRASSN